LRNGHQVATNAERCACPLGEGRGSRPLWNESSVLSHKKTNVGFWSLTFGGLSPPQLYLPLTPRHRHQAPSVFVVMYAIFFFSPCMPPPKKVT